MWKVCRLAVVAAVMVMTSAEVWAQAPTATVRGRVQDAQGRPVSAATVTVTAADTGVSREVPVDADGGFVVAGLPPAVVDVRVAASGFAETRRSGLVLEVGQSVTVDVALAVAGVQEKVDVRSSATGVDT